MPRKFKTGDRVVLVDTTSDYTKYEGQQGLVTHVEDESYTYTLVYHVEFPALSAGSGLWLDEEDLEFAAPSVEAPTPELSEEERSFAYQMLLAGHEVEPVLDIIRALRKGV